MKKISKLMSMLLVLVLSLSLCGCGDKSKEVQGTWGYNFDMGDAIASDMGSDYDDFESVLEIRLMFDFNEDGTFKMCVHEDSFIENFNNWVADFADFNVEATYATFTEMGIEKEDADAIMEEQFGGPMKDYLIATVSEQIDPYDLISDMELHGVYEVKGNKFYMNEGSEIDKNQYDLYEISGNTLTFNLPEGAVAEGLVPGMEYPMVLTKEK